MDTDALRHDGVEARFAHNHAFVVGIDAYQQVARLQTAVNDAVALAEILAAQQHFTVHPPLLDASGAALRALLHEVLPAAVGADDRVLFYFAGHGIAADGDDGPAGYLVPADADPMDTTTFVPMSELQQALEALPCRHMLLVLDCCFSGAFRWSSSHRALLSMLPKRIYRERYDRFLQDPAWQVLTSAAYDQKALDVLAGTATGDRGVAGGRGGAQRMHSPFALALFDGLAGVADVTVGREGDGVITATELYAYVRDCVEPQTQAASRSQRQTPGFFPLRRHDKGEFIFANPVHRLNLAPIPNRSPYKGLASFDETDGMLFYGRDRVVAALRAKITTQRLLVVSGASGTGKSSVLKAGLLPQLRGEGHTILPVLRPGSEPLQELQRALDVLALQPPGASPAVLLVDQFEELVTRCGDPEARLAFLARLRELVDDEARIHRVLVSVRADFEPQLALGPLDGLWQPGRVVVPPFSLDELREVVVLPTLQEVLVFEPAELVDEIIGEVVQSAGALPLLSYTLDALYEAYRSSGRDDRALLKADYDALGGVSGALSRSADRLHAALPADEQAILRKVMLRMVVPGGDRASRRVPLAELAFPDADAQAVAHVVDALVDARLLVKGQDDGYAYVEPAHDALVRSWKALGHWLDEVGLEALLGLAKVGAAASDYVAAGRIPALLWNDNPRLHVLLADLAAPAHLFNVTEVEFIRASERRRKQLLWRARGMVAAVVLALGGLALVALDRARVAEATVRNARLGAQLLQDTTSLVSEHLQRLPGADDVRRVLVARSHSLNRDLGLGSDASQQASAQFWRHVQAGDAAHGARADERTANPHFAAAYVLARHWVLRVPGSDEWQLNLALVVTRHAQVAEAAQRKDAARALYTSALGIYERLAGDDQGRMQLAFARSRLGHLELLAKQHAASAAHFRAAIGMHRSLSAAERHGPIWLGELSASLTELASALEHQAAPATHDARGKVLLAAIAVDRLRIAQDPANIGAHHALALDHLELGRWHLAGRRADLDAARRAFGASLQAASRLVAPADAPLVDVLDFIELQVSVAAEMNAHRGFEGDVQALYREVVQRLDTLPARDPAADMRRSELIDLHLGIAERLRVFAKPDPGARQAAFERAAAASARARYAAALSLADTTGEPDHDADAAWRLAGIRHSAGLLELAQGAWMAARAHFVAAVQAVEAFMPDEGDARRHELVAYKASISEADLAMGNCTEALRGLRAAAALQDDGASKEDRDYVQALIVKADACR